jgi:tetratricopeptide (TPR) repeat protein
MSIFKRLFKKSAPAIADPVALRDALFAAATADDADTLLALCEANRAAIVQHFPDWSHTKAYAHLNPNDPAALVPVVNGLQAIAVLFRDKLNDPSLHRRLVPPADQNPFTRFDKAAAELNTLFPQHRYEEAADLMAGVTSAFEGVGGPTAEDYRGVGNSNLGIARLQSGRAQDAVEPLRKAVLILHALKNANDYAANLQHLYEAYRYLGQSADAAWCADHLAEAWGDSPTGRRWRTKAAVVRAGEPLLRMVVSFDGQQMFELDELPAAAPPPPVPPPKTFYERNRPILLRSAALVRQGDGLLTAGRFADALPVYRDAAAADPFNPHPHYQLGMTHLLLEQYPDALAAYADTVRLAPGWYNVGSETWIAQRMADGTLEHHLFVTAWTVENAGLDAPTRLTTLETVLPAAPAYPHLHLLHGQLLLELGQTADARAAFQAGLNASPEPDLHSRLLAALAPLVDPAERLPLYEQILSIEGANMVPTTLATAALKLAQL